jgi:hypothetical protein
MHALKRKGAQYVGLDVQSLFQKYAIGGELPRL